MVFGDLYDPITGMLRLGLAFSLLIVVFVLSQWKKLDIEKELGIAAIRGFCQLILLALVITVIFDLQNLFLVLVVLIFMVTAGGYTSAVRAKGIPKMFTITLISISIGSAFAICVLIIIGVIPLKPEFLIPLGGMAIGNSMIGCSLTINRIKGEFKNNKNKIETALVLGATSEQAGEPYFRASVRAALIPTIDNLKTLGIVFIPGAMTGMLMAGADVLWAAEYQIAVFLMIISSKCIAIIILTILMKNRLFTEHHQLNENIQLD